MATEPKEELNISQILGRAGKPLPPEAPRSSPEDYAPKRPLDPSNVLEAELAQDLKTLIRNSKCWVILPAAEKEALDLICTELSRICFGRKYWKELREWVNLGLESSDA